MSEYFVIFTDEDGGDSEHIIEAENEKLAVAAARQELSPLQWWGFTSCEVLTC